jgi:ParB family transcriptional regulator, chromosome partitioning protein
MAKPKGGLGRGLGALIPTTSSYIVEVPVDAVLPNPMQPRFRMDPDALNELAASIREHGVLQPLVVTELPAELSEEPLGFQVPASRYQLIAGERRLEASKLAGRPTVPVIVKEASPQESLEWALIENVQRADLNALEEATAYRHLIDEFSLTQEQVAEQVGKSRFTVANCLRLLNLPEEAKGNLASGEISEGHARALLALDDQALLLRALRLVVAKGLSVRQTEELTRRLLKATPAELAHPERVLDAQTSALEDEFRGALGTKVELQRSKKGGKLTVYFYSEEELEGIYRAIVKK